MSDIKADELDVTEKPVTEDALSADELDTVAGGIAKEHVEFVKH